MDETIQTSELHLEQEAAGEAPRPPSPPHRRLLSLDRTGGVSGQRHILLPIDDTEVRVVVVQGFDGKHTPQHMPQHMP